MKKITIESGQNLIDIALQEYGNLEAVLVLCDDNGLYPDSDLYPGQELLIREKGVDDVSMMNIPVMEVYSRKKIQVNSRSLTVSPPDQEPPAVDLPTFYGAGPANLNAADIMQLTMIYRNKKEADGLIYVADMERLWYAYPQAFGLISHAIQPGGYEAFSSFELVNVNLYFSGELYPYYAFRLKHDTYLTAEDNFKMSFY